MIFFVLFFCLNSESDCEVVFNSSATSWNPSNLEFASYVEFFMTSLPAFQIGSLFFFFFVFLVNSCFDIFMPVFVYQFLNFFFYGNCSSLTLFSPPNFHPFIISLCRLIWNGIIAFLSKLHLSTTDFVVSSTHDPFQCFRPIAEPIYVAENFSHIIVRS